MYIATYHLGAPRPQTPAGHAGAQPAASGAMAAAETAAAGGWFGSSLDLLRGLEVRDLGPADWLIDCEVAPAAA